VQILKALIQAERLEKDVLAADNARLTKQNGVLADESAVMNFDNRGLQAKLHILMAALKQRKKIH